MTILVESDATQIQLLQSALGGAATVVSSLDDAAAELANSPGEYAVLVGLTVRPEEVYGFAEQWRVRRPSLSVLLIRQRIDRQVLTEALRSGVREVLEARDLAEVANAVTRAHQLHQAMLVPGTSDKPVAKGPLLTVFSTKGGVGKTTVAANLGAAMAKAGRRVCVVDADVASGDVALMLRLFPQRTVADLSELHGVIDAAGIRTLLTEHASGLSILAAPLSVPDAAEVRADEFGATLEVLRSQFEVVIVDTAPAFDDFALQALDLSALVVLVGNPDMLSLKNLKLAHSTLNLLGIESEKVRLVLNRAEPSIGLSAKDFTETLGLPVSLTLPNSKAVISALNKSEALVLTQPRNEVSKAITAFARTLDTELGMAAALRGVDDSDPRGSKRSLFRRSGGRAGQHRRKVGRK